MESLKKHCVGSSGCGVPPQLWYGHGMYACVGLGFPLFLILSYFIQLSQSVRGMMMSNVGKISWTNSLRCRVTKCLLAVKTVVTMAACPG